MNRSPLEDMMDYFVIQNIYGVGQVINVDNNGSNNNSGFEYLHPHFCIIRRSLFDKFSQAIHHGAPLLKSMLDLSQQKRICLINFPIEEFITHLGRGTRNLNPPEFLKDWES